MSLAKNTWVFDEQTGKLWYGAAGGSLALLDTVEVRVTQMFVSNTSNFIPQVEAVVQNPDEGSLILAQSPALGGSLANIGCSMPTSTRRSALGDAVVTVRNNLAPYTIVPGSFPATGVFDDLARVDAAFKDV